MSIALDHPLVQSYLAQARRVPADDGLAAPFVDQVQDLGGDLRDVCLWLAHCQDDDLPAMQLALRWMDQGQPERALRATCYWIEQYLSDSLFPRWSWAVWHQPDHEPCGLDTLSFWSSREHACNDLRRLVLAPYTDVVYERHFSLSLEDCRTTKDGRRILRRAGSRMEAEGWLWWVEVVCVVDDKQRRATWRQRTTAAQLLPPHISTLSGEERWRYVILAAEPDRWRRLLPPLSIPRPK
jgi:hypothetical protein